MAPVGNSPAPSGPSSGWEGPLFLVGMPRSGTKLLRALLTQHPGIRIPPIETEFLPFIAAWVGRHGPPHTEQEFVRLFRSLRMAPYFRYREGGAGAFSWKAWRAACRGRFDAAGLFEGFIRCEAGVSPGSGIVWGDKSPTYIRHLDLIAREFPQARIVHIVRDVRDVVLSARKAWNKDILRTAHRWARDVREAHTFCLREPARSMELKYEDLVSAPEEQLRRLCAFIGVPFSDAMLCLQRPTENLGDTRDQIGIVAGNRGKFRGALSAAELQAVEALAWETMLELEYAPQVAHGPRRLSRPSLAVRRLKDGMNLVLRDVEGRGVLRSLIFYLSHWRTVRT